MEQKLIKQLQRFRHIQPSEEFKTRSLRLIFASPQHKRRYAITKSVQESVTLGVALVLASLLLLIMLGGFTTSGTETIAGGNPGFNIKIGEARYIDAEESRREVAFRLQRLEDSIRGIDNVDRSKLLFEISELKRVLTK